MDTWREGILPNHNISEDTELHMLVCHTSYQALLRRHDVVAETFSRAAGKLVALSALAVVKRKAVSWMLHCCAASFRFVENGPAQCVRYLSFCAVLVTVEKSKKTPLRNLVSQYIFSSLCRRSMSSVQADAVNVIPCGVRALRVVPRCGLL